MELPPITTAGELPPDTSEPLALRLATNPFLQMGLGVMATGRLGAGMMRGLQSAAAFEQWREKNRIGRGGAPRIQQILQGEDIVTIQTDPITGASRVIGRAPRWQAQQPQDNATTRQRDYEFLLAQRDDQGNPMYTPEQASKMSFGGSGGTTIMNVPSGYQPVDAEDPSAGLQPIPGGPATQPTESERSSQSFYERMAHAENQIGAIEDPPQRAGGLSAWWAQHGPNWMQSNEGQMYRNAAEQWIRAKLRKESGAVIGEKEMADEYRTFFPVPGDSQAVIEQKQKARKAAGLAMRRQAGRAATTPASDTGTVKWGDL